MFAQSICSCQAHIASDDDRIFSDFTCKLESVTVGLCTLPYLSAASLHHPRAEPPPVRLNRHSGEVECDGVRHRLPPTLFRLLRCLLESSGATYDELYLAAKGMPYGGERDKPLVRTGVTRLRRALRGTGLRIVNYDGFGYELFRGPERTKGWESLLPARVDRTLNA